MPAAVHSVVTPKRENHRFGNQPKYAQILAAEARNDLAHHQRMQHAPLDCQTVQQRRSDSVVMCGQPSVRMFADRGDQQARHAPRDQSDQKHSEHGADPPRFHGFVRQVGLHQALQVQLLAQRLAARGLEVGERDSQLLIREYRIPAVRRSNSGARALKEPLALVTFAASLAMAWRRVSARLSMPAICGLLGESLRSCASWASVDTSSSWILATLSNWIAACLSGSNTACLLRYSNRATAAAVALSVASLTSSSAKRMRSLAAALVQCVDQAFAHLQQLIVDLVCVLRP